MKTKTTVEMFDFLVQACVDGGWLKGKGYAKHDYVTLFSVSGIHYTKYVIRGLKAHEPQLEAPDYIAWSKEFIFADLIMDADAMRAALGDRMQCSNCGRPWGNPRQGFRVRGCQWGRHKAYEEIPAWQYHAHKALDIIYDKGTEAAINYLYDNLGGKER